MQDSGQEPCSPSKYQSKRELAWEITGWVAAIALLITLVWFVTGGWDAILVEKLNACIETNKALEVSCNQYFNRTLIP